MATIKKSQVKKTVEGFHPLDKVRIKKTGVKGVVINRKMMIKVQLKADKTSAVKMAPKAIFAEEQDLEIIE